MNFLKYIIVTLTFQLIGLISYGQNSDSTKTDNRKAFMINFSRYNHAERIYDGTWNYSVKEHVLEVKRRALFAKEDSLILEQYLMTIL